MKNRSGKTSIKNVVFHKMEPSDTLFLDPTTKTNLEDITCSSFITFQVYDCSGQIDLFSDPTCDSNALLKGCGSLIFVIDAQVIILLIFLENLLNKIDSLLDIKCLQFEKWFFRFIYFSKI